MSDEMGCGIAKTLLKGMILMALAISALGFGIYYLSKHIHITWS